VKFTGTKKVWRTEMTSEYILRAASRSPRFLPAPAIALARRASCRDPRQTPFPDREDRDVFAAAQTADDGRRSERLHSHQAAQSSHCRA
jgi:hypothetical protein